MGRGGRWFVATAVLVFGCGGPNWTAWMSLDASAARDLAASMDAGDDGAVDGDGDSASDVRDAGPTADLADAPDTGVSDDVDDAGFMAMDVRADLDAGTSTVDAPVGADVAPDRGSPVDIPSDRGIPVDVGVDVPLDRGSPTDVPVDRGSAIDVGFDVPLDRGDPLDVQPDRGSPTDTGVDVPIDRGNVVDTGVDVAIDRGVVIDVGVDVPIDRGITVDVGADVPVNPADGGVPAPDPVRYTGTLASRTGRFTATLTVLGERRSVVLAVPVGTVTSPPLLLVFHGTNSDGAVAMTESNAQALANSVGVIVAAPSSRWLPTGDFDHETEETYWETAPNADPDHNQDLVLVRSIMVEAQRAYGVDPMRIYAMGHSNGAFFAQFIAVILRDRIAAFSENSGGIVRCGRTTACRFQGSGTSCSALRTQPGYCACSGAELPIAVPTSGRMPPGLLTHGTQDPLVSVDYTCSLAELMTARGHTQSTLLFDGEGHGVPTNWAQLVWPFFATRRLGDR